jgi:hypothetical protein
MLKAPDIFTEVDEQTFLSLYSQVCTRCFGWGLPYTCMIPMADNLNHNDVYI